MSQEAELVYDVIVLGAGPGGYTAALKAGQLGLKTAIVEKEAELGGTCLRVGCIPSKALLHSSEQVHFLQHGAEAHGITVSGFNVNVEAMLARKTKVVSTLTGGIALLMKSKKVTVYQGKGVLTAPGEITVTAGDGGTQVVKGKSIILATGSVPSELPNVKFDGQTIVSSTEALSFEKAPEKLLVIGGGAIGLELGSVWSRLGSQVTVVEFLPQIGAGFDPDVAKALLKSLQGQGLEFYLETSVTGVEIKDGKAVVSAKKKNGEELSFTVDKVLMSVGRRANTAGCVAEGVDVKIDERGRYVVDKHFQTTVKGVYAIGDAVPGVMLAHKAEEEAVALVERLAGTAGHVNYDVIPGVIYTSPEAAMVGLTEPAAKEKGYEIKTARYYLRANARALANDMADGFVKVIADAKTDRVLGVHMLGGNVSELIAEAVLAMEFYASAEDIGRTVHAHPTMAEALKEAALGVNKMSVNMA
jgi:dihydrolipoamide dehydrogenase